METQNGGRSEKLKESGSDNTHHAQARCYPKKKVPKKTLQIQKI